MSCSEVSSITKEMQTGWHLGTFCLLLVCVLEIYEGCKEAQT